MTNDVASFADLAAMFEKRAAQATEAQKMPRLTQCKINALAAEAAAWREAAEISKRAHFEILRPG